LVAAGLFVRDLYRLPEQPVQVLAAAVLLARRRRDRFKLMVIDPAIAPGGCVVDATGPMVLMEIMVLV
jgi:hypothetical protein